MSCDLADYLHARHTRQELRTGQCSCGEWWTEIDGERVVDCKCREEEADKEKTDED